MPKYFFEDFAPGSVDVWGARQVTREEVIAFAQNYDPQPHHLDDAAAEASILKGLSASGWHSCALAMRMACDWFLLDTASMGSPGVDEVRWKKPVRPGDVLALRRTVLEPRLSQSKPDRGFVPMIWELVNQNGEAVMSLQASTIVARRAS
jgi:acyl dehydratase